MFLCRAPRPFALALSMTFLGAWLGRFPAAAQSPSPPPPARPTAQQLADSYRRLTFDLNLVPIEWSIVEGEAAPLKAGVQARHPGGADRLMSLIEAGAATEMVAPAALSRRKVAVPIFTEATRLVAGALTDALGDLGRATSREAATEALDRSMALWSAFAPEVTASDPGAKGLLDTAFKQAQGALGRQAVEGAGEVALDRAALGTAAATITAYVEQNFGRDFDVGTGRLAPLPRKSSSFNPAAPHPRILPPGNVLARQAPRPRQILNMVARGVDERDTALIAVGDMAFDSAAIFGEPARSLGISCNTCHNKGVTNPLFFIPGLSVRPGGMDVSNSFFAPHANNGHYGHVDTPDLRGIRFTAPYGRNGRFADLREFSRNVIVNEFNGAEPDPVILDGLVAYMNEFDFIPNPLLNSDGRLLDKADPSALRGEVLFRKPFTQMDGKSCASCHVPTDNFLDHRRHDVGTVGGAGPGSLDRAMDTPTLLGCAVTAPYFNDGSQPDLAGVVRHFDTHYKLALSEPQQGDLVAYLKAVGGGTEPLERSIHFLASEMEEFVFFLSSYDFLKEKLLWGVIGTLFETVAAEVRFHSRHLQDKAHAPIMERLAVLMDEARAANKRGDLATTDRKVEAYLKLYSEHAADLK